MKRTRQRPSIESLESREVPATAVFNGGLLTITGDPSNNLIRVRQSESQVTIEGIAQAFPSNRITQITVNALAGDDQIDLLGVSVPIRLNSGDGSDVLLLSHSTPLRSSDFRPGSDSKIIIAPNGAAARLDRTNTLRVNSSTWSNVRDFGFDRQGRMVQLQNDNWIGRSRLPFGSGGSWEQLGSNVTKWQLDVDGNVWALSSNGELRVNGGYATGPNWANVGDFAFDNRDRLVQLDRAGWLGRSKLRLGSGGWDRMGTGVTKWQLDVDGNVWALQSNGELRVNGGTSTGAANWTNVRDFAFDRQDRGIQLDRNGWLGRSKLRLGTGGWDRMGTGVTKWQLDVDGNVWALQSNGELRVNGGTSTGAANWTNVRDFAFDGEDRLIQLDRNGWLGRSRQRLGAGGFDRLGAGWVTSDGMLWIDGTTLNGNLNLVKANGQFRVDGLPIYVGGKPAAAANVSAVTSIRVAFPEGNGTFSYNGRPLVRVQNANLVGLVGGDPIGVRTSVYYSSNGVVTIVPDAPRQKDADGCGPAAASQFLRAHGGTMDYDTAYRLINPGRVLGINIGYGTKPGNMSEFLRKYRSSTKLEILTELQVIVDLLRQGRPVNALINWDGGMSSFHWFTLSGVDTARRLLTLWDPATGGFKLMGYDQFMKLWNWDVGWLGQTFLATQNVRTRTIIY